MKKFFNNNKNIVAVMSQKKDADMRLGNIDAERNQQKFFEKLGFEKTKVKIAGLVHGNKVKLVKKETSQLVSGTDALVTKEKDTLLAITVADCLPVLFFDSKNQVIGLAHAGWRSLLSGVLENTFSQMKKIGANPRDTYTEIGPAIGECHFEIQDDVIDEFNDYKEFIKIRNNKKFVDLKGIAEKKLLGLEIPQGNIKTYSECTFCEKSLFSFRRDKKLQAQVVVLGMR